MKYPKAEVTRRLRDDSQQLTNGLIDNLLYELFDLKEKGLSVADLVNYYPNIPPIVAILVQHTNLTRVQLGKYFNKRNHSTITHYLGLHLDLFRNSYYRYEYIKLLEKLNKIKNELLVAKKEPNPGRSKIQSVAATKSYANKIDGELSNMSKNRFMRIFYLMDIGKSDWEITRSTGHTAKVLAKIKEQREYIINNNYKYKND